MSADIDDAHAKISRTLEKHDQEIEQAFEEEKRLGLAKANEASNTLESLAAKGLHLTSEDPVRKKSSAGTVVTISSRNDASTSGSSGENADPSTADRQASTATTIHTPVEASAASEDLMQVLPVDESAQGMKSVPPINLDALPKKGDASTQRAASFSNENVAAGDGAPGAESSSRTPAANAGAASATGRSSCETVASRRRSSARGESREAILALRQAEACRKLQSLWKGHKARISLQRSPAELQVLELRMSVKDWDTSRPEEFLVCSLSVWNLKTSEIVFAHKTNVFPITESTFQLGHPLVIPGMDNDCVLGISLSDPRPGGVLFEVKLLDVANLQHSAAGMRATKIRVKCEKKGLATYMQGGREPSIVLCIVVRSSSHTHTGWLWASRGAEDLSSRSKSRSPRLSPKIATARAIPATVDSDPWFRNLRRVLGSWIPCAHLPNQIHPLPSASRNGDSASAKEANPRPFVSTEDLEVSEDNRANAWECYWGALINGRLYLYETYGDLTPLYVIRTSQCKTFSSTFSGGIDCPEFAMEATPETPNNSVTEVVGPRRSQHRHLRDTSRVWFVTTSRSQTVTWVAKLRAARS